jgi:ABC-type transport system involved in multi-copper enzyme maturation permease subunit
MAWVTWRQHRLQLLIGVGLLAWLALAALVTGLPIRAAYHREALAACLPPATQSGCDIIVRHFQSEFGSGVRVAQFLILLPALAGAFIGAPLLARELEHGTFKLAWTQTVTRRRWLLSKTMLLGIAVVVLAVAASALVMWWRRPFDSVQGRMSPSGFEIEGLVVPAYAIFALTLGVLAGAALRRSIPAISAALIAFFGIRLAVSQLLRPNYLTPVHETAPGLTATGDARDWVLSNGLVDAVGRHISAGREDLAILHAQNAGIDAQEYLVSLGWRRSISFQPADRFWTFQAIEAAIFLALAAATLLVTLWLLRRRPS